MDSNNRTASLSWKGEFPLCVADQLKVRYNIIFENKKKKPQSGARAKVTCAKNRVCIARHKLHSLETNENVMVLNVSKCQFNADIYWDCSDLKIIWKLLNTRDVRLLSLLVFFQHCKRGKTYATSLAARYKKNPCSDRSHDWVKFISRQGQGFWLYLEGHEVCSHRGRLEDECELCTWPESLILHMYLL